MGLAKHQMMEEEERGYRSRHDKYVCADCVGDKSLKALISKNSISQECSYCKRTEDKPIAAEFDIIMNVINTGVRREWDDPDDAGMAYEQGYCGDTYTTDELVLSEIEELQDSNEMFLEEVINAFSTTQWCKTPVYAESENEMMSSSWSAFCYYVKHFSRYEFLLNPNLEYEPYGGEIIPFGQIYGAQINTPVFLR